MPVSAKVAEAYVVFKAQTAEFRAALNDANVQTKRFASNTRQSMQESQGAVRLLGEEVGIRMPRELSRFVAGLPAVSAAMSAAFNAIAIIGLISIVVEAGKKIHEFATKGAEDAAKLKEAQEEFGTTVQKTYNSYEEKLIQAGIRADELKGDHLDALHKQLQLINMQGFEQLEGAFKSLESAADKTFDNIKTNWVSLITQFSMTQASGFKGTLDRFGAEYQSLLAQGKGDEAQNLLNTTQQREEQNRTDLTSIRATGIRSWAHSGLVDQNTNAIMERLRSRGITDYSDETYNAATQTTAALEAQQNVAKYQRSLTGAQQSNLTDTYNRDQAKSAAEASSKKDQSSFTNMEDQSKFMTPESAMFFWSNALKTFQGTSFKDTTNSNLLHATPGSSEQFKEAINKYDEAVQADARQRDKTAADSQRQAEEAQRREDESHKTELETANENSATAARMAASLAKLSLALSASDTKYQLAVGHISKPEAAKQDYTQFVRSYLTDKKSYVDEMDAISDRAKGLYAGLSKASQDNSPDKQTKIDAINKQIADLSKAMEDIQEKENTLDAQHQAVRYQYFLETENAFDQVFDHIRKSAQ
jgi:hypothetical protein